MATKKASPPPTGPEVESALDFLKARILAEMAKVKGLVPGSQSWIDMLERRINNAIDGTFVLKLKNELLVELPKLVQGGKGPVTKDDVDLA